jgi:orotidine-5'-phosphate decarboxylase
MKKIFIALDYADAASAYRMADALDPSLCGVKVGKELFTRIGPEIVRGLSRLGFDVFLDLKYHDIPATVAKACLAAADLGAWMINVHALGGATMMHTAATMLTNYPTRLIAVTVLTSMGREDLQGVGIMETPDNMVLRLAQLAATNNMHGVVCSPQEITLLRQHLPQDFLLVTPGIRPTGSETHDQKRIMTPQEALSRGSNILVIGRPITHADNPSAALQAIVQDCHAG